MCAGGVSLKFQYRENRKSDEFYDGVTKTLISLPGLSLEGTPSRSKHTAQLVLGGISNKRRGSYSFISAEAKVIVILVLSFRSVGLTPCTSTMSG